MIYIIYLIVLLLVSLAIKARLDEVKHRKSLLNKYINEYGGAPYSVIFRNAIKERLNLISRLYYRSREKNEPGVYDIDDITYNDLDMDELFCRLNFCETFYGEEYLYQLLRRPVLDPKLLEKREWAIKAFLDNPKKRGEILLLLHDIGKRDKLPLSDALSDIENIEEKRPVINYLCLLSGLFATCYIFINPAAGFFVFFGILFVNVIIYFISRKNIYDSIKAMICILRLLERSKRLYKVMDMSELESYRNQIEELYHILKPIKKHSYFIVSGHNGMGSIWDIVLDYFRMFLHIDIIEFYALLKFTKEHKREIKKLAGSIGFLDAMAAIGAYRNSLPNGYCIPELSDASQGECFVDVKGLVHPYIDDAVDNDFKTSECILITGSNATGKSTFLRSVALSCIMAQTIFTVKARIYRGSFMRVATSMTVSDDLLAGDSYYMAEIKALKRIMDYSEMSVPLVCFIDEVLRGTNTAERIAASEEILRAIRKNKALCFAATHDLELASLLSKEYISYHFTEEVDSENEKVYFSYKIKRGKTNTRNAINLLKLLGYDESVTERASMRCQSFLETGSWN